MIDRLGGVALLVEFQRGAAPGCSERGVILGEEGMVSSTETIV